MHFRFFSVEGVKNDVMQFVISSPDPPLFLRAQKRCGDVYVNS